MPAWACLRSVGRASTVRLLGGALCGDHARAWRTRSVAAPLERHVKNKRYVKNICARPHQIRPTTRRPGGSRGPGHRRRAHLVYALAWSAPAGARAGFGCWTLTLAMFALTMRTQVTRPRGRPCGRSPKLPTPRTTCAYSGCDLLHEPPDPARCRLARLRSETDVALEQVVGRA